MFKKKPPPHETKLSDEGRTGEFHLPPKDAEVVEQLDAQLAKELEAKEAEPPPPSPPHAAKASKVCPTCGNPFPDGKAACAVDGTSQEA